MGTCNPAGANVFSGFQIFADLAGARLFGFRSRIPSSSSRVLSTPPYTPRRPYSNTPTMRDRGIFNFRRALPRMVSPLFSLRCNFVPYFYFNRAGHQRIFTIFGSVPSVPNPNSLNSKIQVLKLFSNNAGYPKLSSEPTMVTTSKKKASSDGTYQKRFLTSVHVEQ